MVPITSISEFIKEVLYICPNNLTAAKWPFWLKSVFSNEPRRKLLSYDRPCIHTLTKVHVNERQISEDARAGIQAIIL